MRRTVGLLTVAVTFWLVNGAGVGAQEREVGETYLARLLDVWEQDASVAEVEALVSLLSEDATYEHPRAGARIDGRRAIENGMAAFLGSSRGPEATEVEIMSGPGVVVLGFDLRMEVHRGADWSVVERRQVIVLEISDGRIVRVTDHW